MQVQSRLFKLVLTMAAALGLSHAAGDATADDPGSPMLGIRLLRSDAVVFATVSALRSTPDHPDLVDVEFEDVVSVRSRWDLRASPLQMMRVRGTLGADSDGMQVKVGRMGDLREGGRYLLLLAGGEWTGRGPFPDAGLNMLEVRSDGYVGCGSGVVYGVNRRAIVCGHPEDFASQPVREGTLRDDLARIIQLTRQARPNMERQQAESVRPLELLPRVVP